ncbi:MAG: glycosyltransferase [Natronohydrobacter sp.]|nr:glycosyltransferase [Natronohydrobacter sp.]
MSPKVSIITVVFNNVDTIGTCIESVLAQDYENIEYIVIDGASTDGTTDVIERYRKDISVYISEKDGGIYDAMNKGLSHARGDVIAFLNADDQYFPDAVSSSVKNLEDNKCDLSYAGFYYADDAGRAIIADGPRPWDDTMLLQGIPGGHETIFAKRSVYDRVGPYDLSYKLAADYHWVMRAFKAGTKAHGMAKTILVMAAGGTSFNQDTELRENRRLLEENFGRLDDALFEKLYDLKFYKNWHGSKYNDRQLIELVNEAKDHSPELAGIVARVAELRKAPLKGQIRPACARDTPGTRVLVVLTYLSGVNGGAERIAIEQANELHARGYQVTVVSGSGVAGQPYYRLHPDIPHIDITISPYKQYYERRHDTLQPNFDMWKDLRFPELGYVPTKEDFDTWLNAAHLWRARMYASFLIEHEFDIVLAHMPSSYPYILLLDHHIRAHRPDLRIVASLHNAPKFKFYAADYPAESTMDRFMRLATLHRADRIGLLFEQFRAQMPATLQDRCVVIPDFTSHPVRPDASGSQKTRIIAVGRLAPQKDHSTLIRAYERLRQIHPDWTLHIYGEGPLHRDLCALATELGLNPDEIFRGSRQDIEECYDDASIFVIPSRFEGFGLVVAEAMAAGLPVIGFSDCEGVKYIVQHEENGLLVEGSDRVQGLADGMQRLIEDPAMRARLSQNAPATAEAFSCGPAIDALEESVRDLLPPPPRTHNLPSSLSGTRPLRVLIMTSYTTGGAGIAAMRLHRALLDAGHQSRVLTFSPAEDETIYATRLSLEEYSVETSQHPIYAPSNRQPLSTLFSPGLSGVSEDHFAFFEQFDVINIHWVANMLRYDLVERLAALGKPLVWTLHDMNPFTGGCHYSDGCTGYRNDCRQCPQLIDRFDDIAETVRAMKADSWPWTMSVVAPSRWLAREALSSAAFRGCRTTTIPNSVDLDKFRPLDTSKARASFGLPQDKKILLFSSFDNNERRKGFPELLRTAERLVARGEEFHIVALGAPNAEISALGVGYTAIGHLSRMEDIAQLMAAADVTVLPTLEDNLPNVILESLACGTPVAAFAVGGVPDAVIPGISGALAPMGDVDALADAIQGLFRSDLGERCRAFAETRYAPHVQAAAYGDLFSDLVSRQPSNPVTPDRTGLFAAMERRQKILASTLRRAHQDVTFLKKLTEDFRTEIADLRDGAAGKAVPASEAARDNPSADLITINEERFFGDAGFINIHVAPADPHPDNDFYMKLWTRSDGIILELRENDGAFACLPRSGDLDIVEDTYGRVVYLYLLDHDHDAGPDMDRLGAKARSAFEGVPDAIRRAGLSKGAAWLAIAEGIANKILTTQQQERA